MDSTHTSVSADKIALLALKSCNTLFGHVIDECRRVSTSLRFCKFQHVRREGNRFKVS